MSFIRTYYWELIALVILAVGVGAAAVPLLDDIFMPVKQEGIVVRMHVHESGGWTFGNPPLGAKASEEINGNIILKKGEKAKIILIGGDVPHSLVIPELGIDSGPISPGKMKVIEFTPDKAGTFTFYCGVICSPKHHFLNYKLVVMEP